MPCTHDTSHTPHLEARPASGARPANRHTEKGAGDATLTGTVEGNVEESGAGDLAISATGVVKGNATEKDGGIATNSGTVTGNVTSS